MGPALCGAHAGEAEWAHVGVSLRCLQTRGGNVSRAAGQTHQEIAGEVWAAQSKPGVPGVSMAVRLRALQGVRGAGGEQGSGCEVEPALASRGGSEVAPAAELRGRQPTGTARERLRRGCACTCLTPPARLVWTVCRATAGFSSTAVPRGHKVSGCPPRSPTGLDGCGLNRMRGPGGVLFHRGLWSRKQDRAWSWGRGKDRFNIGETRASFCANVLTQWKEVCPSRRGGGVRSP